MAILSAREGHGKGEGEARGELTTVAGLPVSWEVDSLHAATNANRCSRCSSTLLSLPVRIALFLAEDMDKLGRMSQRRGGKPRVIGATTR